MHNFKITIFPKILIRNGQKGFSRFVSYKKKNKFMYEIIFRMAFVKLFPKQFLTLTIWKHFDTIEWESLYPNIISMITIMCDNKSDNRKEIWNTLVKIYKEDKSKWPSYPEMIYLFESYYI